MSQYHRDGSQSGNTQNKNIAFSQLYNIYILYMVGYRTKDTKSVPLFVYVLTYLSSGISVPCIPEQYCSFNPFIHFFFNSRKLVFLNSNVFNFIFYSP